ncbi:MAG: helix-hairpin-helix domain-containing protein [Ilumatobacteraceae bacterium]
MAADAVAAAVERARLIGPARVAATAATIVAVVAGTYWLVRPPELPTEAVLPFATATTSGPSSTGGGEALATTVVVAAAGQVTVHVAGAVRAPGVYALVSSARVVDAVRAAGGLAADADADRINLAATLADGQRVYVPRAGEDDPLGGQLSPATGSTAPSGPVNLNSATASELETLPGIGPTTAAAIVAHRDLHGPFASVDELGEVAGIGPAKLAALRGLVTV